MECVGTDHGFPISHHPLHADALKGDRDLREKEYNRDNPYYLPIYTEVWTKAPRKRREIYRQFLHKPIIYQGLGAEPRWMDAAEDVHELDRDLWALAVQNRADVFFGQQEGRFIRQKQLEGELGYAALPIPFSFNQLSGFFEFVNNYLELLTLTENWLAPRRIDKPDVWKLNSDKKAEQFPASHCAIRPRVDNEFFGHPHLLELVAGHACNFKIEFGPYLQEVHPIHKRSGLSPKAIAKRVVISVTMNEGSLAWGALGPRIVLSEAPLQLIEYIAKILLDPDKGIGAAWHRLDGREQEAFLTRPLYYPLPTFDTGPHEKSSDEIKEIIRRCWMERKLGQSFELGDGPWNTPWPHEAPGDNLPEPVFINGKEYRPIRVSARPLTPAVDFTKLRPPNWGTTFKDERGKMQSCFPMDKRMRLRGSILDCHKGGAAELYNNILISKWDRVDTGPAHAPGKYEKASRAKRSGPRPAQAPQRRLTPPASSINSTAALTPITAPRSAGSSSRHRTAMPTAHRQDEERQERWEVQRNQEEADDWGIPPDERIAPTIPAPQTHYAAFPNPPPRAAFEAEARARHMPAQEQARQQAEAAAEEEEMNARRQRQAEEQAEQARVEAMARAEQERAEFQTLRREITGIREVHEASDARSEVSLTSSSTAWRELDRTLARTYHTEAYHWGRIAATYATLLNERAKARTIRMIHRAGTYHYQRWMDNFLFLCRCGTRNTATNRFCTSCGSQNPQHAVAVGPTQPDAVTTPTQVDPAVNPDMAEFLRTGFFTSPRIPVPEHTDDLAADQVAGISDAQVTPQTRPAQAPFFATPDMPQPSGFWAEEAMADAFATQLAEAMANPAPQAQPILEPAAPQQPASQTEERTTHYTRQQEREDRGEWEPVGAQQTQWQERWNATQENANLPGPALSLDELAQQAQQAANRLWRVQTEEEPPRPTRTFADLPSPADALPHYQAPAPPRQQEEGEEEEVAAFTDWRDAPPMRLEERITAATHYGGRFFLCFHCVELCNACGNHFGHRQWCWKNEPDRHGREPHSQLYWLRAEGLFVWPYDDQDWREFLPANDPASIRIGNRIREITAHLITLDGVEWRQDVWRGVGEVSRRGGYVVSPHLLCEAIHREAPPFVIHCSGLSGRRRTTPTLQMNGRPSFNTQWYNGAWFLSFCVRWNQLDKSWDDYRRYEEGLGPCFCPKRPGTCQNEEQCNYVWCDRWDRLRIRCPTAVWHKDNEDTFLF